MKDFAPPLVSVIIANYNYGRFLRAAVDSVFEQTYPNIECIIVDDASTDESPSVLVDIATAHPSAKIIRKPKNDGELAARIEGLRVSAGDYVLFLDADDLLLEECIATHVFVNLSLRLPVGFTCSDLLTIHKDRLVRSSRSTIGYHVNAPTTVQPFVRPIQKTSAGEWISTVDPSILDRLYAVDPNCREWPWSQTSGMFFRRDALEIWAITPGLAELRNSTDGFFARGINALTGSVLIDQPLAVQRLHGANKFFNRVELSNLMDYDPIKIDERTPKHRTALLNEVMRDPQRFNLFDRSQLKTILETFEAPDTSPGAPDWAKSSLLSNLLVQNYDCIAKILGEHSLISWLRERKIPEHVIVEASGLPAGSLGTVTLPLLSFVVVNHNYGRFLRACVESIMSQNYTNVECIVVDNASTDNSAVVLQSLVAQFPTLKAVNNKENLGQSTACATGFALTNADYVAFIDADDYLLPDFAATHIRAHLSLPVSVGFTSCDMTELVDGKLVLGRLAHFGAHATFPVDPQNLRDIKDISVALGSDELTAPKFYAPLRLIRKTNIDWVWSSMSGGVYRSDAIRMFAFNPRLKSLKLAADCYFNFPINALFGSALIYKSLTVYRIHGDNNFTKRAALDGTVPFRKETDEGAKAAFLALQNIVSEFALFCRYTRTPGELWSAMQTLARKSGEFKWLWGERMLFRFMKLYFTEVLFFLSRRFKVKGLR